MSAQNKPISTEMADELCLTGQRSGYGPSKVVEIIGQVVDNLSGESVPGISEHVLAELVRHRRIKRDVTGEWQWVLS